MNKFKINDEIFDKVELEIGFGSGEFIVNQSIVNKNTFYIGIEIQKRLFDKANSIISLSQKNIILYNNDACFLINSDIIPNAISTVHIYYPSPGKSKLYTSKEIISEEFFKMLDKKIDKGGILRFISDDYKTFIKAKKLIMDLDYWIQGWVPLPDIPRGLLVNTVCERKYESTGDKHEIYAQKT